MRRCPRPLHAAPRALRLRCSGPVTMCVGAGGGQRLLWWEYVGGVSLRGESACVCVCRVPNARPGRDSMDVDVYGMEGIPDGVLGPEGACWPSPRCLP